MTALALPDAGTVPASGTRCKVGVVGLGYAGLPQAVAFAEAGHPVIGLDVKSEVVAALRAGRSPVDTVSHEQVGRLRSRLTVLDDARALADCSAVLVCVPTPLDENGRPDLAAVRAASAAVAANLRPGHLVVIESTVYPGVTDGVVKPILETSGLRAGVHFNLAFAPERVDPGNPRFDVMNTPKVIGGLTPVCALRASELYRGVVSAVHIVTGLREAEAAKILENTYRQVNLALVHEFAAYCTAQGIDVAAVIDAAATKPFGFQPFYPGIGVGGHCIPVDPMYLAYSGRELGVPLRLVELAQRINDERPEQVAELCAKLLSTAGRPVAGAEVLLLGVSYKPAVADVRNTPAVPLVRGLTDRGIVVSVHDPLVPEIVIDGVCRKSVPDLALAVRRADLVLVAQRHPQYRPDVLRAANLLYVVDCQ
jgi:nucleotide sugar dehydrogenase